MKRRHWIYGALGVLLLLVNLYAFWPLVEADRAMDGFCDRLKPGSTLDELRALATARGYTVSSEAGGLVRVEDPDSMGRRSCTLQFGTPPRSASGPAPS